MTEPAISEAKNPVGRPTSYPTPEELPERVEKMLALFAEGADKSEISATIFGIDRGTLDDWAKKYPEFHHTIKKGEALSLAWWSRTGRVNLHDKEFSPALWYMNMKNRHGWKDKTEVDAKLNGKVTIRWLK